MKILSIVGLALLILACKKETTAPHKPPIPYAYDWFNHLPFVTQYGTFNMPITSLYSPYPEIKGEVNLSEASGIAFSRVNSGKLWAHNDSGHPNTLFLIDTATAEIVASYNVLGTVNIDWEDMEVAYGPIPGRSYIYVGDIGDNNERRPSYDVYRFEEPVYDSSIHYRRLNVINDIAVDRIRFFYPDKSHDCEALMVDPATKDIYLATKRDAVSMLFVLPYPQKLEGLADCFHVGNFSFREASAGSISMDGQKVLIKNRQEIFYWERADVVMPLWQLLAQTPVKAPYAGEPQGEAICFDPQNHYYTLSEALNSFIKPNLYKYYLN
ncbi:MAG: hypothetical protein ACK417_05110 [Bacteroidia bacterium]